MRGGIVDSSRDISFLFFWEGGNGIRNFLSLFDIEVNTK